MANISEPLDSDDLSRVDITESQGASGLLNQLFTGLVWLCAASGIVFLLWIAKVVFQDARPAIEQFGLGFLWGTNWDVNKLEFGGLPFIYGSVISSLLALAIAIPLSLAVALTTSENFLPASIRYPIGFLVELIASIPSVIIGLWGIFVLIPIIKPIQEWLFQNFAWFPLFSTQPLGPSMLIAGVILAVMIVPTISAISRDVLLTVPKELRSASMALGATRWETIWRVLLPTASSGIVGAIILGLGRALGETMAVAMVIGNSSIISPSLLAPGYTIPAVLANTFPEAFEQVHIGALMYLALILFLITLAVNSIAALLVQFINRGR
ncbi:phosphate ABC transporter permease subunit PstC [Pannus brasiliensis CCIBt3594]|uniref:Phosphate transport system permease protein n=1 Tax=Pannus brasiliensis CCIBt3594 TaxID=1427578 RepID=A0AAW9QLZ8_9CHRO